MPGTPKKRNQKKLHSREDDERTLRSLKQELKPHNKGHSLLSNRKVTICSNKGNMNNVNLKRKKIVNRAIKTKTSKKKLSSSGLKRKPLTICTKENGKTDERDVKRRRRRSKSKKNVELDEASRIQRRTRYLLVKIKLEQNLIDAYSAEGWKGQSREKIRPEKELQRAKKQILMYKLSIREALHQLDLLSSEGRISDSKVASDGSIHHKHIVCAKCIIREALPDNDIILCDGTCNRAFHQMCLDPPLLTENIPPGDEGWFCKFCKMKMEILEATNAHVGTHFPLDSNWQDVFEEEANLPDDVNSMLRLEEEWPSDDSEDNDYDPDRIEHSGSDCMSRSDSDASDHSSSFLVSLEDEAGIIKERRNRSLDNNSLDLVGVDSEDGEVVCRPRQRASVDYIKLYDEMFGKNATENEQNSDDEDWGPGKRKGKVKDSDTASTLMNLGESEICFPEKTPSELKEKESSDKNKRPIFRLPRNAVEKLRLVFAENELPERALRVSLSKQLGLEFEKVNKWFKNSRYLALKSRKQVESAQEGVVNPDTRDKSTSESEKGDHPDRMMSSDSPKNLKKIVSMTADPGDDVSLIHLKEKSEDSKKKSICKSRGVGELEAETEIERLCEMKNRVEKLQQMTADPGDDVSLVHLKEKTEDYKKKSICKSRGVGELEAETEIERLCEMKNRVEKLQQMTVDPGDDVSLVHLKEKTEDSKKKSICKSRGVGELEAETEMERLCEMKNRVEKLQQILHQFPSRGRFGKSSAVRKPSDLSVIFVPVAELKEKR